MREIRFDHIAIAVPRLTDAPPLLVGVLGGLPERGRPSGVFRWATWRFAGGGRIEILEPLGPDGFLQRFLARHGPGVHHVTFRVPSLRDACARAAAHGYSVVGYNDSDPAWKEAFLHPKEAQGIVVQLAESSRPQGPQRPFDPPPPGPSDPPPPVTILGLRLRASSRERALIQWGGVLQARSSQDGDGALGFAWPGSPMGLTVEVDPAGAEGPVCIEFSSDRPVAVPAGPDPRLGTVFARRPERET